MQVHPRFALPCSLALLSLLAACAGLDSPREVAVYDARTLYGTVSLSGASFSADGRRLLVTSDESGVFNVYSIPISGGEMAQLTHSTTDAITSLGWFPDDDRFLYTSDRGGNERNHIYVQMPQGASLDLTPGEEVKAQFLGWAADERSFFVLTNERDPQYFDLYRYHLDPLPTGVEPVAPGFGRRRLYENTGGHDVSDVSRDGAWVALTKIRTNSDSDVYLVPTAAGGTLHVTAHSGEVSHGVADFAPDGSKLFYTSDEGGDWQRVWSYDLTTGDRTLVFEEDWDVQVYAYSHDGRWLVTATNADARTEMRVFDATTGREVQLPRLSAGDLTGAVFEPQGTRMAFYVNGDASPSNLFVLDLERGHHEQLTETLNPAVDAAALVEAEVVRYPSFDDLAIPALLYRPHAASAANRVPALVWVHGGPGGQSRRGYNPTIQHLVNHGYAVLAVNNRGSSGYGKKFFHLDDKRHGEVDLQDCIFGRRWLESLDWVDPERIGIIGGSYGGYMVCAALAFEPEAFEVGIDIFGVTNWIRTLESIPPWWADFRDSLYAELGDPVEDRARLEARSPLLHPDGIQRPLLVIQGQNDPRVLEVESREIVAAVEANGVPVEYVVFPDEGHGFRSKENRIRASEAYLDFLNQHLRGAPLD